MAGLLDVKENAGSNVIVTVSPLANVVLPDVWKPHCPSRRGRIARLRRAGEVNLVDVRNGVRPTKGPPPPTGGSPRARTGSMEVSEIARARFKRPLPV